MIDSMNIRDTCLDLAPDLQKVLLDDSLNSKATWEGNISNGKSLEVLAICSLFYSFKDLGAQIEIPEIYLDKPYLFYLQNTLPLSNPTKAGHSSDSMDLPIEERFIAAFTPKFEVRAAGKTWSIYKEGVPSIALEQFLNGNDVSIFRPDIAILEGVSKFQIDSSVLNFTYFNKDQISEVKLRILDAPEPRVVDFKIAPQHKTTITALVECSVNKPTAHLSSQLENYLETFGPSSISEICYFYLNGNANLGLGCNFNASTLFSETKDFHSKVSDLTEWISTSLNLSVK